jgi:hypothetical protein
VVSRIALIVGGVAAATVLAVGVVATAFGPPDTVAAEGASATADEMLTAEGPLATPITRVQTETVYVRPAPTPKTIRVTRHVQARSGEHQVRTVVVRRTTSGSGGHERDDDRDEERGEHEDRDHHEDHEDEDHEGGEHEDGDH